MDRVRNGGKLSFPELKLAAQRLRIDPRLEDPKSDTLPTEPTSPPEIILSHGKL